MGDKAFDQAYNCQAAVGEQEQIIMACEVTNNANDRQRVEPMVKKMKEAAQETPERLSADSSYYSEANAKQLKDPGIGDYICPGKEKHGEVVVSVRGRIPQDMSYGDRVRKKLSTKQGRATYVLCKNIVKPVFRQMKYGRGLRQFLLRGFDKVDGECGLCCVLRIIS